MNSAAVVAEQAAARTSHLTIHHPRDISHLLIFASKPLLSSGKWHVMLVLVAFTRLKTSDLHWSYYTKYVKYMSDQNVFLYILQRAEMP